jgi:hypothetical protein
MEKRIALAALATCFSFGTLAQGSVGNIQNMFWSDGIQPPQSHEPVASSTWFTGNATNTLYYAAAGAVTQTQINAINAPDYSDGSPAAVALLGIYGFVEVSATSLTGSTTNAVSGFEVTDGGFSGGPNTISLLSPVPTDGSGWLAMVLTAVSGTYTGWEGVLAWSQPNLGAPGNPANIVTDPGGLNLVITPIPEPGTLALAALGGASLLLLRFRKH